jgi:plastocyanin
MPVRINGDPHARTGTKGDAFMADGMDTGPHKRALSRRTMLRAGVAGAGMAAIGLLVACGGSGNAAPAMTMTMPMPTGTAGAATKPPTTAPTGGTSAAGSAAATGGPQVQIDNFAFSPKSLTVPVGTEVVWTNHDDVPHTVTSRDKAFSSQALDTDERFTFTFKTPGTYAYFCAIHPIMTAEVVVK